MKCDCVHYAVCRFRAEIEKALTPLIEPGFPRNPRWDEIEGAVGSWCRFREPGRKVAVHQETVDVKTTDEILKPLDNIISQMDVSGDAAIVSLRHLLRQVFYYRLSLGNTVEDIIGEQNKELWDDIYSWLKEGG